LNTHTTLQLQTSSKMATHAAPMSDPQAYPQSTSPSEADFDPAIHLTPEEQKDLLKEAKADEDDDVSDTLTAVDTGINDFVPSRKLVIHSLGMPFMQFPTHSRQLEIEVKDLTTGRIAYSSRRERVRSGNAILSAPGRGALVQSLYRFGPGRNPKLVILGTNEEVTVKGKWPFREQHFKLGDCEIIAWKYARELVPGSPTVGRDGKKVKPRTQVICEVGDKRVAMLVRNDDSRTPGTTKRHAGNGGHLLIDEPALKASGLGEELIVATCIMMLKKEMDRRRARHMAAFSAMASA